MKFVTKRNGFPSGNGVAVELLGGHGLHFSSWDEYWRWVDKMACLPAKALGACAVLLFVCKLLLAS